ncbi:ABC transporter ATP-binding protein [Salinibacter ruber]|uniref:ABC transporter ATP-binding protein n=1 Tax=Salinibacter ruber TaxID=146919 RepID=UPI002169E384|nr:ABC transporter ATP-binding protein [Salinibacter ruber]MCS3702916.1 ABC-2 type transport system ATP-binding protein [Salinibacter ruber]MCS4041359.1 ABC-2 type transport system ATP-binding protein [Salinibacter ruber]
MPALSVSSLSKTYRTGLLRRSTVQALDGISLAVEEGAIFGLLGPNGAGKTTLVKILLGLVRPSGGTARLFGRPAGTPAARHRIGFVPENHRFPGFFTATQTLHAYGRLADVPRAKRNDRIPQLLDRLALDGRGDTKVKTFSKGMLQRLGLAQALLNEPDLLFLDEPTGGVDPVGRRAIRDIVLELRDEGKTIFLNSHLLSEVEKVCTQIAILRDGTLVRRGSVEELTAVDRVYDLVATPVPDSLLNTSELPLNPGPDGSSAASGLDQYRVHADDRTTLNAVVDRLRSADVEIESITPLRQSLEDYFIDVVDSPT